MNTEPAFPLFGNPNDNPNNLATPYNWNVVDSSRGTAYFNAPASNSTMVSDSVEMTKRLKMFVPSSSVKEGRSPGQTLMNTDMLREENNEGSNYKSKFQ